MTVDDNKITIESSTEIDIEDSLTLTVKVLNLDGTSTSIADR